MADLEIGRHLSHRVTEDWMGEPVDTLADLLRPGLFAVCVGINPAPASVAAGHYYQGPLGRRFYRRLRAVGLLPDDAEGWEDDALFARGVGFTDIVKRPSAGARQIRREEYAHGRAALRERLDVVRPRLVIFTFKKTATVLFPDVAARGFLPVEPGSATSHFVMPGPYEAAARRDPVLEELRRFVGRHRA